MKIARAINDGGAIVGTAHTPNPIPDDKGGYVRHGVMLISLAFVRETPVDSGTFTPIKDNGRDDQAQLPVFATESGSGLTTTTVVANAGQWNAGGINGGYGPGPSVGGGGSGNSYWSGLSLAYGNTPTIYTIEDSEQDPKPQSYGGSVYDLYINGVDQKKPCVLLDFCNNSGDLVSAPAYYPGTTTPQTYLNGTALPSNLNVEGMSNEIEATSSSSAPAVVVGSDKTTYNASWWDGTLHSLGLQGAALGVNAATATVNVNGTPTIMPAIQIVGSLGYLWEMNPTTGLFNSAENLNDLLPATSSWNNLAVSSGHPLNDGGAIVGYADALDSNGNPIPDGYGGYVFHGVLCYLFQFARKNIPTSGVARAKLVFASGTQVLDPLGYSRHKPTCPTTLSDIRYS